MAKKRLSMQERMRQRRSSRFVGREQQLELFKQNLDRSPADENYYFIFNVYGQGGVGKTTLVKQYEQLAKEKGHLFAYTDESVASALDYMHRVAKALEKQDVKLKSFQKRYEVYLREKKQLEAHPEAPKGFMDLLGRSVAKASVVAAREFVPGANVAMEYIDDKALAEQAGSWASHVKSFIGNKDEVELVLRPEAVLTPLWLEDLAAAVEDKKCCLVIDTFEEVSKRLEGWLLLLLKGEYGDTPEIVQFVVAGRGAFTATQWADFAPFTTSIPLEPFSDIEARNFLKGKGIKGEAIIDSICSLSGNLPVWLDMLGEEAARGASELRDPSGNAVSRYLSWITDSRKRDLALSCALPRMLHKDIVEVLSHDREKVLELFDWIISRPFVKEHKDHWKYHDVVREHMLRRQLAKSKKDWQSIHGVLGNYYETLAKELEKSGSGVFWNDDAWHMIQIELMYHRLCENYAANLPKVQQFIITSIKLTRNSSVEKLLEMICDAEKVLSRKNGFGQQLTQIISHINQIVPDSNVREFIYSPEFLKQVEKLIAILYSGKENLSIENTAYLLSLKAEILLHQNIPEAAIEVLKKAIDINPKNPSTLHNIGIVYDKLGQSQKAIKCLQQAVDAKSDMHEGWYHLGCIYGEEGELIKAIAAHRRAIEIKSDYEGYQHSLGWIYLLIEDVNKAKEHLLKAWELSHQTHPLAPMNLAHIHLFKSELDQAIPLYQKSLALQEDPEGFFIGMDQDYIVLKMADRGIPPAQYDQLLQDLRDWYDQQPKD